MKRFLKKSVAVILGAFLFFSVLPMKYNSYALNISELYSKNVITRYDKNDKPIFETYTYICGFNTLLYEDFVVDCLNDKYGGYIEVDYYNEYAPYAGTGASFCCYDSDEAEYPVETFFVVIFGDVNGDSQISSDDIQAVDDEIMLRTCWSDEHSESYFLPKIMAADLNKDGIIDWNDKSILQDVVMGLLSLNQLTGEVYGSDLNVNDIITFGSYPQSQNSDGTFNVEPIEWRVLENNNGELLLLSEKILDAQPYHNEWGTKTIYWADSSVSDWLRNEFYNVAFNDNQKAMIVGTLIKNKPSDDFYYYNKIFLLSEGEADNIDYGFNSGDSRIANATPYAWNNGLEEANWWLRPSVEKNPAMGYVRSEDGRFSLISSGISLFGIRPALRIKTDLILDDDNNQDNKIFPSGYDFETDKWGQANGNNRINQETYELMFGPSKGESLYNKHESDGSHGICYGYTSTTALLMENRGSIVKFRDTYTEEYIETLSEIGTLARYETTEFYLNAIDFVKLGYIYQFDAKVKEFEKSTKNNLQGLVNAVKSYVNGTGSPLIINVSDRVDGKLYDWNRHSIYPIGYLETSEETIIYIYDSNSPFVMQELKISNDSANWKYIPSYSAEDYNLSAYESKSNSAYIDYSFPSERLYDFLSKGIYSRFLSYNNLLISSDYYLEATDLGVEGGMPDVLMINELIGNSEKVTNDSPIMYWVEEGYNQISLTSENDTDILVSDNYSSIKASAFKSKPIYFDFSNGMDCEFFDVESGEIITVTFTLYKDDIKTEYLITGTSKSENVIVSMNNEVIKTTGLKPVEVQLFVEGDKKSQINIDADEEIEISVSNNTLISNIYNITWNIDGEETKTICKEGAEITLPQAPQKTGYTFAGWTPEIPDAMPAEDLEFSAVFTPNSYDAVFDANGGVWADGAENKTVATEFDSEIIAPETPEKQGYVFSHWSPEVGIMDCVEGKTFTAVWLAATDTRYSVETYIMNTSGEYEKSVQNFAGTTDSTVNAEYSIENGFALNAEKSVLSGTVAADNSLVLSVYIDRNSYKFTTVVDGSASVKEYLYGSIIAEPEIPVKSGFKFIEWSTKIPETMPAEDVTITAVFENSYICPDCGNEILGEDAIEAHMASEARMKAKIRISNNSGAKTINYGETLKLTAIVTDMPVDAAIAWYVDGVKKGEGEIFNVTFESGTKTVEVKIVDINGNPINNADGNEIADFEKVTVNSGLWQKIVSFFKNLFKVDRTVIQ